MSRVSSLKDVQPPGGALDSPSRTSLEAQIKRGVVEGRNWKKLANPIGCEPKLIFNVTKMRKLNLFFFLHPLSAHTSIFFNANVQAPNPIFEGLSDRLLWPEKITCSRVICRQKDYYNTFGHIIVVLVQLLFFFKTYK